MRSRDAVGFSESLRLWAADVFSWQRQGLEHLSVHVLLELCFHLFFSFFFSAGVFDLLFRYRDCAVSAYDVMGLIEHSKVHMMGTWWSVRLRTAD